MFNDMDIDLRLVLGNLECQVRIRLPVTTKIKLEISEISTYKTANGSKQNISFLINE